MGKALQFLCLLPSGWSEGLTKASHDVEDILFWDVQDHLQRDFISGLLSEENRYKSLHCSYSLGLRKSRYALLVCDPISHFVTCNDLYRDGSKFLL